MTDSAPDAYQSALDYLYSRLNYERLTSSTANYPFRLRRTMQLMQGLGLHELLYQGNHDDRPDIPIVHVAGTKGKGSTSAMVAQALTACGLRTGLYTSPHLHRLEERFRVDGQICPTDAFVDLVARMEGPVDRLTRETDVAPSFFELTTCLALLHFVQTQCDVIVLEVGLGGRLDSTNVCAATIAAITSIGLDHQHVLGDTVEKIAAEKAGIIKTNAPVISGVTQQGPAAVIRETAESVGAPLAQSVEDFGYEYETGEDWGGYMTWSYSDQNTLLPQPPTQLAFPLNLEGEHQAANASVALAILGSLEQQGMRISLTESASAIGQITFPGRIEKLELDEQTDVIVDTAHNRDSIQALCRCVSERAMGRQVIFVFGTSRDKDATEMLANIAERADNIVLTQYQGNPRFLDCQELHASLAGNIADKCTAEPDPVQACETAVRLANGINCMIVICGSFFLAAEARPWALQRAGYSSTQD